MKIAISLVLSLCIASSCFCQSDNNDPGKWEIGLNVLPLFDSSFYVVESVGTFNGSTGTLASYLLIRRNISNTIKLRCNIGFRFDDTTTRPDHSDSYFVSKRVFGSSLSLGAEKYVRMGRLSVYFGGAFSGYYLEDIFKREQDTRPNATPPTIYKIREFYSDRQYALEGLAGINLKIISGFYLSFESSFLVGYRKSIGDYKQREGEMLLLTTSGGATRKRYIANFRPISAVQLIYQF
jgi:hypothetical protein